MMNYPSQSLNENKTHSNRRITCTSLDTERRVEVYRSGQISELNPSSPTRTQALEAAKRFAAAIGLKAAKIGLIDKLFAFTATVDWNDRSALKIIWPTNELLARRLGIQISTLKHHLAGLVEAGIISYSDHPTYQRKGRRDATGRIVEAYGIDLSPIAARYSEFLSVFEASEHEARQRKQLSDKRTIIRRQIEATFSLWQSENGCFDENWSQLFNRLNETRQLRAYKTAQLAEIVGELLAILTEAKQRFQDFYSSRNLHPSEPKFRPLQTTEESQYSVSCNGELNCANAQYSFSLSTSGATALEEKPKATSETVKPARKTAVDSDLDDDIVSICLPVMRNAMTNLMEMLPDVFDHWSSLRSSAETLCRLCYINPQVYRQAVARLGQDKAIVALALTAERSAAGSVTNAGGYLRALIERAGDGKLHLSRSLFAMASAQMRRHQL